MVMLCTTANAGVVAQLLNNEEYTYEALGAMVYYHTHCAGISPKGLAFAKDAIEKYYINTSNIHTYNESYIKGWKKANDTADCQKIYDEFDNYWLSDLLNDTIQDINV